MEKSLIFYIRKTPIIIALILANSHLSHADLKSTAAGEGIQITTPNVDIEYSSTNTTNDVAKINLGSSTSVNLEWAKFNIGTEETVNFNFDAENASSSVVINNITGGTTSNIFGTIESNGHVYLVNPNGFVFSESASISTQGFLATTYTANYNDTAGTLSLGGGNDTASIDIQNLNGINNANYIAFYSPKISIGSEGTDSIDLGDNDVFINTSDYGTIELPGFDIGFTVVSVDPTNVTDNLTENLSFISNTKLTTDNKISITQKDINNLLSTNVKLPELLTANTIELNAEGAITIGADVSFAGKTDVENLTIQSHCSTEDCHITLNEGKGIYGQQLNLKLIAGSDGTSNVISETSGSDYSLLGGINGLNSVDIHANSFSLGERLKANRLNISGDLHITAESNSELRLDASDYIKIGKDITFEDENVNIDLQIFTQDLTVNSINKGSENINIRTDNFTTQGEINFSNRFELDSYTTGQLVNLNISNELTFIGSDIYINDTNIIYNEPSSFPLGTTPGALNFGTVDSGVSSLFLTNINTADNTNLSQINIYTTSAGNGATLELDGELSTSVFKIANQDSNVSYNLTLNDNFTLSNLNTLDLGSGTIKANASQYDFIAKGTGDQASTANIHNSSNIGLSITDFGTVNLTGDSISSSTRDITIKTVPSAQESILVASDNLSISTTSGNIEISEQINADSNSVSFITETGQITLNGVAGAQNITMSQSTLGNKTHIISGNYTATDTIDMSNFGEIQSTSSELNLSANTVDLIGTQLTLNNQTLTITAGDSTLGGITAENININGQTPQTGTTHLTGDLMASNDLDFHIANIELLDDITMSGNINLLDAKDYNGLELEYINEVDGTFTGEHVANLYGTEDLNIETTNQDIYLYNFGEKEGLSSLTINGKGENHTGNLHIIENPTILGATGLSILGNWTWTKEGPINFITDNYNLNLSGVSISSNGIITFNTGTGDLTLADIQGSDLIIESAGTLGLHGDINLTKPALGYNFENVTAIELYRDLTIGSSDAELDVNFGDATIDGTYSLTLYSGNIKLGAIGKNIALQNLNIYSSTDLTLDNDINLVGDANINSSSLTLNANLTTTGRDVNINTLANINMNKESSINADNGSISLNSQTGNINLGALTANNLISVISEAGYINNAINDYVSNIDTSINISSSELYMSGVLNIGESVSNPIVISMIDSGTINVNSNGNIYIANLSNSPVIGNGRIFDSASVADTTIIDAYNQLELSSFDTYTNPTYETTLGLIDHINWQSLDDDEMIRKIKRPVSSPNIYRSRNGWRLGY